MLILKLNEGKLRLEIVQINSVFGWREDNLLSLLLVIRKTIFKMHILILPFTFLFLYPG